jgi:hypothetical protein
MHVGYKFLDRLSAAMQDGGTTWQSAEIGGGTPDGSGAHIPMAKYSRSGA